MKKLEAFDFKVVADLFNLVNSDAEKETELVDLFARYYEKVSHSRQFLCWAIEWEVSRTEHPSTLFRLESVATGLLFRHFFSDDGMYCLEMSVCPLIERVAAEVSKHGSTTDLSKDVEYLLKQTSKFLFELESSCALFPLDIRQAFVTLQHEVAKLFPDTKNALAVVLFLRFLCPTILQPASFGITEEPLGMDVVKVLLPIARLLQCIANETIENKIVDSHYNDRICGFIKENIEVVRKFCEHLTNEQEIGVILKMTKVPEYRPEEKDLAMQNIVEYITGSEFPMPSLEMTSSARQLPALVKKRKVYSLDDRSTRLENLLDYVKINVVYLFVDLEHPSYTVMMDESAKIRADLDKLGVKQFVISGGTTKTANAWYENTKYKGEVLVDTSSKIHQLFSFQKRKSTKANLYTGKMSKIRKKFAIESSVTDGLAWATKENLQEKDSSGMDGSSSPCSSPRSSVDHSSSSHHHHHHSPQKSLIVDRPPSSHSNSNHKDLNKHDRTISLGGDRSNANAIKKFREQIQRERELKKQQADKDKQNTSAIDPTTNSLSNSPSSTSEKIDSGGNNNNNNNNGHSNPESIDSSQNDVPESPTFPIIQSSISANNTPTNSSSNPLGSSGNNHSLLKSSTDSPHASPKSAGTPVRSDSPAKSSSNHSHTSSEDSSHSPSTSKSSKSERLAQKEREKEEKAQKEREKRETKEREKEEKRQMEKEAHEKSQPKAVKLFVLFGDRISFESKFEGQPQDLLNLLQACGARPEVIETARKRLKKKKKLSFFSLRRNSVKVFSSSLKDPKDKERD